MSVQKLHRTPVTNESRPVVIPRVPPGTSVAPSLPRPRASEEHVACMDAFLGDLRAVCGLIGEADRYGATPTMEEEYRRLRSELATGYHAISRMVPDEMPSGGFHGCGFEMILGNYSLEGLVRNTGVRAIDRLSEVWRTICPEAPTV